MPPTKVHIRQGNKSAQWFVDNAGIPIKDGQLVHLNDDSGLYKKGDGVRTIGALPWLGGGIEAANEYTDEQIAELSDQTSDALDALALMLLDAIALKANINSPTFTGIPVAPTASNGTNTTQIATCAFVLANAPTVSLTDTYIGFGSAGNAVTGSAKLIWTDSTNTLSGSGAIIQTFSNLQFRAGTTATNYMLRVDSAGVRVGQISTAGNSNTAEFQVGTHVWMGLNASLTGHGVIWLGANTPSSTNYAIRGNQLTTMVNGPSNLILIAANQNSIDVNGNYIDFFPGGNAPTIDGVYNFRPPTTTGATASAERRAFHVNMGSNPIQHATGALATQRDVCFTARTHSFIGASTITDAGTVVITNAPQAGSLATITNAYALWIQAGKVRMQGLPTSSAGLQAGDLWNNGGVLNIV